MVVCARFEILEPDVAERYVWTLKPLLLDTRPFLADAYAGYYEGEAPG
jgi:hypothetical protein